MLKRLAVENYVLISSLEMELSLGLNTVTGETGAGKSILLGALGVLLGNRTELGVLKNKESNCVVEGIFDVAGYGLESFFDDNDLEYDVALTIRRVITPSGKSRAYVNDLPVQLSQLKELGAFLIDIHSQHQSLMVGKELFRLDIIDSVAGNSDLLAQYRLTYDDFRAKRKELDELRDSTERDSHDREYLRFQTEELCAANIRDGEQEELEELLGQLSHAQEIGEALAYAGQVLGDDETGVLSRLKNVEISLSKLKEVYIKGGEFALRIHSVLVELKELERDLEGESGVAESDPAALSRVGERLDILYALQQKYRVQDICGLIELRDRCVERLEAITGSTEQIEKLEREATQAHEKAMSEAGKITASRSSAASVLKKNAEVILRELGMPDAIFNVEITDAPSLNRHGGDNVQFLFSANRNVGAMPVEKIASGGEISRLMLALKSIVAAKTKLPTIIFDEIDSGVSGLIADRMGMIINRMAHDMQILNITHLPQVASKGDTHFLVYKDDNGTEPRTTIRKLTDGERIEEIAKMLSGSEITQAALTQATLLLDSK